MNLETLRSWKFVDTQRVYGETDTILYALGLGLGRNFTDAEELRFVTESNLRALPMMGAVVTKLEIRQCLLASEANVVEAFHGEQRSTFERPLPPQAHVIGRGRVRGVWDKGRDRGALIEFEQDVLDADSGARYCQLRTLTFARRDGGSGGDAGEPPRLAATPERPPEFAFDMPTLPQAALIYRLSGDRNPLHSDPATARQAGLPTPMLHGYCTYGIAGWAIIRTFLGGDPAGLRSLDCRFSAPAFPGETLRTEMWRAEDGVAFRVRVLERDALAITHGRARLRG